MSRSRPTPSSSTPRRVAVIGAGIAGLACARTLLQAGHAVELFEAADGVGGRLFTQESPFGGFDAGAQYFTVRDPRFELALQATAADVARRWSANAVRVLDEHGRVVEAPAPSRESHWVAAPAMASLAQRWAESLARAGRLHLGARLERLAHDRMSPGRWELHTRGAGDTHPVHAGFEAVLLALPASSQREVLSKSENMADLAKPLAAVQVAPCWTLMVAYPNAAQSGQHALGPQWNAARSTHHRVAWLARESSKPRRSPVERWTIQASDVWSREHADDDVARVTAKLLKAFAEVTGIRATPAYAQARLWPEAKTSTPLGQPFVWDAARSVGLCGDWCLGYRVEDAFLSGLQLALRVLGR